MSTVTIRRRTLSTIAVIAAVSAAISLISAVTPAPGVANDDRLPEWLEGRELRATYADGIALIYEHRCVPCHRPGEIAPMSFLTYNDIRRWVGRTNTPLETLIQTRAMPPWPADPAVGRFSNSLHLTAREMNLTLDWIRNGFPGGEGTTNPARQWVEGWSIGKPDHVFELPKHTVAADTETEAKQFVVETSFPEDRWIVAAEVRPGNESIVTRIDAGPFGSHHPGNSHVIHPSGNGRMLRAGQQVVVQIRYEKAAGFAATDQSKIGVVWAKPGPTPLRPVIEDRMGASDFTIPAGAANFEVKAHFRFDADGKIIALMPIMNLRGKDVRYRAIFPDNSETALLAIPAWDPQWKFRYQLQSPIPAPRGTIVEAIAHFDNSDANIRNPDTTVAVPSGVDSELFEGWISYVEER